MRQTTFVAARLAESGRDRVPAWLHLGRLANNNTYLGERKISIACAITLVHRKRSCDYLDAYLYRVSLNAPPFLNRLTDGHVSTTRNVPWQSSERQRTSITDRCTAAASCYCGGDSEYTAS